MAAPQGSLQKKKQRAAELTRALNATWFVEDSKPMIAIFALHAKRLGIGNVFFQMLIRGPNLKTMLERQSLFEEACAQLRST